jgi:hypothetical protein
MSAVSRCTLPRAVSASNGERVGSSDVVCRRAVLRKRRRSPWRSSGYATNDARARRLGTGYELTAGKYARDFRRGARMEVARRVTFSRSHSVRGSRECHSTSVSRCDPGRIVASAACGTYPSADAPYATGTGCAAHHGAIHVRHNKVAADADTSETVFDDVPPVA